jgi:inosose dehydratase
MAGEPVLHRAASPKLSGVRVASAPVSFGVDGSGDSAWTPDPVTFLDWVAAIGFEGTELGPPGYLGTGDDLRRHLDQHDLVLVGAFFDQPFSAADWAQNGREAVANLLELLASAASPRWRPLVVLSESLSNPVRMAYAGRVHAHPGTQLPERGWATLVANLHRAAEWCRLAGFQVVFHPHGGTFVETSDEIARLMDALDPALIGLCLDTGHFRFGGADPVRSIADYRDLVRHVHIKDCRSGVIAAVAETGGGFREAVRRGVFCPLGEGDVDVAGVLTALGDIGYQGWLVIEQDRVVTDRDTPEALVAGQSANREYLRRLGV